MPGGQLPSCGLAIGVRNAGKRGVGRRLQQLEAALRALPRPVIGRINEQALWLDLRCLEAPDEADFVAQWPQLPEAARP